MYNPVSTIRIQFNKDFRLADFEKIIPFFAKLGIGTVYASPIFAAVPGSTHGYDVTNPLVINPEIGTIAELERISGILKSHSIGWIQDIVPNHMAYHPHNPWLLDVLEKGPHSVYHEFFDISWSGDYYSSRIMAPFLETSLPDAIVSGDVQVLHANDIFTMDYKGISFPLSSRSYELILSSANRTVPENIRTFLTELQQLHQIEDRVQYNLRWNELLIELKSLFKNSVSSDYIRAAIAVINSDRSLMEKLASMQFYRLCEWSETSQRINYRRFFTVNGLIGLNMQNEKVFKLYHQLVADLCERDIFDGLRVDHVDGLSDPRLYLRRLRDLVGPQKFIVVEKILETDEELDPTFPVQGTTGYDFLGVLNNLFSWRPAEEELESFYSSITRRHLPFDARVREKKQLILDTALQGELNNLTDSFHSIAGDGTSREEIRKAIGAFLVNCPYYRLYGNKFPLDQYDRQQVSNILDACTTHQPDLNEGIEALETALLEETEQKDDALNEKVLRFYQRLMQLSGPLMAKGVEDTLMYTYNRFIGHNEVGDSPGEFGISIGRFHSIMKKRQIASSLSLSATATHDTKRGEDTRMRLSVITDVSSDWVKSMNELMPADPSIDKNVQYLLFQAIVGSIETELSYPARLEEFIRKALREGKRHSSWEDPQDSLEERVIAFARDLVREDSRFRQVINPVLETIIQHGYVNSIVQLVLKATCPGVPDFYQNSLKWDFSFVDPDNRRSVDFPGLLAALEKVEEVSSGHLWENRSDGLVKLKVTSDLIHLRRDYKDLFHVGTYVPLKVKGKHSEHVIAFARIHQRTCIVVACMLHSARIWKELGAGLKSVDWDDTSIVLPENIPKEFTERLSGISDTADGIVSPGRIFKSLPVAVMEFNRRDANRSAGILVHVTSLPSPHPVADLGPSSRAFADFLFESRQTRWQWLPVTPTYSEAGFSPYSSLSSMAGNRLLISHEDLANHGLLHADDFRLKRSSAKSAVDFDAAFQKKDHLLSKAWICFRKQRPAGLWSQFEQFKEVNRHWLRDYALFVLISRLHPEPWFRWPNPLRLRDAQAIETLSREHADELEKISWVQFIFHHQMISLKSYCNSRGIQLVGDLPFYVSHCAADTWIFPQYFCMAPNGTISESAGVPPDYFSNDGQAWNMPVYNWKNMSADGYKWWVSRIRHTLELFDQVRLDHFRAFVSYWAIPSGKPAADGEWRPGPGADFFEQLRKSLGKLPIIAEDLGDIGKPEIDLRKKFNLPGMKVLQFGFGSDFPDSIHLPYHHEANYFVYTGTHDNNTTRGWFNEELSENAKQNLAAVLDRSASSSTVSHQLIRMAYSSVASTAIIPIQDILNLDSRARINTPGTVSDNWAWRMKQMPSNEVVRMLQDLTWNYDR